MIWLMSCRAAAQKLSTALEGDITRLERLGLRIHLLSCRDCSRLREQLLFLRAAGSAWRAQLRQDAAALRQTLKPELRESIERALRLRDSLH